MYNNCHLNSNYTRIYANFNAYNNFRFIANSVTIDLKNISRVTCRKVYDQS